VPRGQSSERGLSPAFASFRRAGSLSPVFGSPEVSVSDDLGKPTMVAAGGAKVVLSRRSLSRLVGAIPSAGAVLPPPARNKLSIPSTDKENVMSQCTGPAVSAPTLARATSRYRLRGVDIDGRVPFAQQLPYRYSVKGVEVEEKAMTAPSRVPFRSLPLSIQTDEKSHGDIDSKCRSMDAPNLALIEQRLTNKEMLCALVDKAFDMFDHDLDGMLNHVEMKKSFQFATSDLGISAFIGQHLRRSMQTVHSFGGEQRSSRQDCLKMHQDFLLLACGRFMDSEKQIEVHLRILFNSIDVHTNGLLSRQDLADSALVQRELPFLVNELGSAGLRDAWMPFPTFKELVMRRASGLITVRMVREQFAAFLRSKGKSSPVDSRPSISRAEACELACQQMPYLDKPHSKQEFGAIGRGSANASLSCDEFVRQFVDVTDRLQYQLAQIVGLGRLKQKLEAFCRGAILDHNRLRVAAREGRDFEPGKACHMVFRGNPGTGKTTIAKIVADVLLSIGLLKRDRFVCVQRERLVADVVGATAKLTKRVVQEAAGGLLFVDEAYRLFPKDADSKDFGREAVDELMAAMLEEDAPLMIFAGYPKLMDGFLLANPGLRSRVPTSLDFEDYSWAELAVILDQIVMRKGFRFAKSVKLSQVADVLRRVTPPGAAGAMNGRMCELVFDGAKAVLDTRLSGWEDGEDTMRLFEFSLDDIRGGCANVPPPADVHLLHLRSDLQVDDNEDCGCDATEVRSWLRQQLGKLVGMEAFKEQVRRFQEGIELDRKRAQVGCRVRTSNTVFHMIFAGNPGTGKTTVARLMSELLQRAGVLETRKLVEVHRDALIGHGVVGSAEAATLEIVESARGGVLFVDEANQLQDCHVGQKVIEALMQQMSHPSAPVMIFAGYPEEMAKFEMANKGLASRIPYRFAFVDLDAAALAKVLRCKVERSGFEFASNVNDAAVEVAFEELVPQSVRAKSNGRLCETVLKFAKEQLDMACTEQNVLSSVITLTHLREGIRRASEWGPRAQESSLVRQPAG